VSTVLVAISPPSGHLLICFMEHRCWTKITSQEFITVSLAGELKIGVQGYQVCYDLRSHSLKEKPTAEMWSGYYVYNFSLRYFPQLLAAHVWGKLPKKQAKSSCWETENLSRRFSSLMVLGRQKLKFVVCQERRSLINIPGLPLRPLKG
jgi:hypothetical protein